MKPAEEVYAKCGFVIINPSQQFRYGGKDRHLGWTCSIEHADIYSTLEDAREHIRVELTDDAHEAQDTYTLRPVCARWALGEPLGTSFLQEVGR